MSYDEPVRLNTDEPADEQYAFARDDVESASENYGIDMDRRTVLKAAGATAVAGLAGCLGGGDENDDYQDNGEVDVRYAEPAEEATVAVKNMEFDPNLVWVTNGGTVTWELENGTHDVVAYHPDNDRNIRSGAGLRMPEDANSFNSGLMRNQGDTYEHTFRTDGVFDYVCTPHEQMGMVGRVLVGYPEQENQPGLEEPQDALPRSVQREFTDLNDEVRAILDAQ